MFYGATGRGLSLPERERTVWDRFETLGPELLGPQAPNGRHRRTTGCSRRYTKRPDILLPPTAFVGQSQPPTRLRFRVTRLPRKGQGPCPQRDRRMGLKRSLSASDRGCHRMRPPVAVPHSIDADTNQGCVQRILQKGLKFEKVVACPFFTGSDWSNHRHAMTNKVLKPFAELSVHNQHVFRRPARQRAAGRFSYSRR